MKTLRLQTNNAADGHTTNDHGDHCHNGNIRHQGKEMTLSDPWPNYSVKVKIRFTKGSIEVIHTFFKIFLFEIRISKSLYKEEPSAD